MKTYNVPVVAVAQQVGGAWYSSSQYYIASGDEPIYVQFQPIPAALHGLLPTGLTAKFYVDASGSPSVFSAQTVPSSWEDRIGTFALSSPADISSGMYPLEFDSAGSYISVPYTYVPTSGGYTLTPGAGYTNKLLTSVASKCLAYAQNGMRLRYEYYSRTWAKKVYSQLSAHAPYIELTYDEGSPLVITDAPGGYVNRAGTIAFSWHTTYEGYPIENITQTSATLKWKNGSSGTVNNISISGGSTSYTMAANTLPLSNDLYWCVTTVTAKGTTTSEWRNIQTQDAVPTVKGVSPAGTYIDGTAATRFTWSYDIATGTAQKSYEVQYKTASEDWAALKTQTTANTYADISAGTLTAGTIQWRVRAYNTDNVASEWSAPLSAVVIAAPTAPVVSVAVNSPRPTITWSSAGQQAYQVKVGTYDSGTVFGTAKSLKCHEYLIDGQTVASVRVMNSYGMWSPWGTAVFTIANTPGATALALAVGAGRDAQLSWNSIAGVDGYIVYRNDAKVGETAATEFTDRYSIGQTSYRVRATLAGGDNYVLSDPVQAVVVVDCPTITALDGDWLELRHSQTVTASTQVMRQQDITLLKLVGSVYPVPEVSPYKTRTYAINAAFKARGDALLFESLLGKPVCVKDQHGNILTGIMTSTSCMQNAFFAAYTAVVNEVGGEV